MIVEFEAKRSPPDDKAPAVETELINYDAATHHPVFFGPMHKRIGVDADLLKDFDVSQAHPASIGYAFMSKPPPSPLPPPPIPPDKDTCSPTDYLEHYIFPFLLPALEEMLKEAKKEKCFERKRTKFSSLDFLTVYLYKHNPLHTGTRDHVNELEDIPFVKEWWERQKYLESLERLRKIPRHALPKSLLWTEEEAIAIIQNYWRGYKVRREPEIQELRIWQREWRQETENIQKKVDSFWRRNMPDEPNDGLLADIDNASLDDSIGVNDNDNGTQEPDGVPEFSQSEV
ncbi:hypothetical protein NP493_1308g01035 [Ridgeia piscesae]|uniref:IQ domain-containing protein K n=1 Tax=Ridgeia piscesae TaxID=27915 RepID=A0AAD9K913_RIDPI|nr:hypothetical protein NP493_1308g01035 [Ridgeia piscesae]